MVIITYDRKEVGNMKYDEAPEGGGDTPPAEPSTEEPTA